MKHSQREKTNWETKNQMRLEEARKTDRRFTCTPAENCMQSERERSFFLLQESTSLQFLFPRSGKDFFSGSRWKFRSPLHVFHSSCPIQMLSQTFSGGLKAVNMYKVHEVRIWLFWDSWLMNKQIGTSPTQISTHGGNLTPQMQMSVNRIGWRHSEIFAKTKYIYLSAYMGRKVHVL